LKVTAHPATEQGCAQYRTVFALGLDTFVVKVVQRSPLEHCASLVHFRRHCPLLFVPDAKHSQPVPLHVPSGTSPKLQNVEHSDELGVSMGFVNTLQA
jgi:hypothetical protein